MFEFHIESHHNIWTISNLSGTKHWFVPDEAPVAKGTALKKQKNKYRYMFSQFPTLS